jgi:cyclopropane-fatty-acyl-phospholipid synthase
MLLSLVFRRMIRRGTLTLIDADGVARTYTGAAGPEFVIRLHDRKLHWKLGVNPGLYFGEAFMDGTLTAENSSIYDLLDFLGENMGLEFSDWPVRLKEIMQRFFRRWQQYNPIHRAHQNVAHHYDLSATLYDLFLDADRQYSCAYFPTPGIAIEAAQANKKRHIAAKLLLEPGQRVLDIGSGWGGLALYIARECDVEVTGLTLSAEQLKVAQHRAEAAGLADRVRFELCDYRAHLVSYDRIVSVGMFEHVGVPHYPDFFGTVKRLLASDGVALLHSIGRMDGPYATNPWLRKYIFPGGYSPALSEVVPVVEKSRLWITDIEILRLHYAETLKAWRQRFNANRERIRALYDERFCRMWEFYLAASEVAFRQQGHIVFQIQLSKSIDAVPLTRDYMVDWERSHRIPAADERAA